MPRGIPAFRAFERVKRPVYNPDLRKIRSKASRSNTKMNWEKVRFVRAHPEIPDHVHAEKFNVTGLTIYHIRNHMTWKEW